jgi:DNA-binding NarL/FixJ family response regulator
MLALASLGVEENPGWKATATVVTGRAALGAGDLHEAAACATTAHDIGEAFGHAYQLAASRALRAEIALVADDSDAWTLAHDALETAAAHGYRLLVVDALEVVIELAASDGDHRGAARLAGAVSAARDRLDYRLRIPGIRERVDAAIGAARSALDDDAFARAFDEGRQLSLDETVAFVGRARGERHRPVSGWASLTPTERAVVDKVRLGCSNPQIASQLLMSRDTVKTHLSHVYSKLDVANRTELAVKAQEASSGSPT